MGVLSALFLVYTCVCKGMELDHEKKEEIFGKGSVAGQRMVRLLHF